MEDILTSVKIMFLGVYVSIGVFRHSGGQSCPQEVVVGFFFVNNSSSFCFFFFSVPIFVPFMFTNAS